MIHKKLVILTCVFIVLIPAIFIIIGISYAFIFLGGTFDFVKISPLRKIGKCYYNAGDRIEIRYIGGYPRAKLVKVHVKGADIKSFRLLDDSQIKGCDFGNLYGADKSNVFYHKNIIENADVGSFSVLDKGYSKDKDRVFYKAKTVDGADPRSFKLLSKGSRIFGKDESGIYYFEKKMKIVADPIALDVISDQFAKDSKYVYRIYTKPIFEIIPDADPDTFEVINLYNKNNVWYAKDKNNAYYDSINSRFKVLKGIDAKTFIVLNKYYSKDKGKVFFKGNQIIGADADSFYVTDKKFQDSLGFDKNGKYKMGEFVK